MQPSTQVLLQSLYERYAMRIFTCFLSLLSPLLSRSVEDCSLPVTGTTVSTVGTDPLFRRLRGVCWMLQVLKIAFARSKFSQSGRNRERSIRTVQTSHDDA